MIRFDNDDFGNKNQEEYNQKRNNDIGHKCPAFVRNVAISVNNLWKLRPRFFGNWRDMSSLQRKKTIAKIFGIVLGLVIFGSVAVIIIFASYSVYLPSPTKVVRRDGFSSRVYDRNGKILSDIFKDDKRVPIVWDDVPDYLKKATIAIEDKSFYQHQGFDPLTPLRIAKNIVVNHRIVGGSTLTQQLVKNVLLTSERTVTRKLKEFILAVQIEAKYSKDQILLMYLNEAPYGGNEWGVGIAAEELFGKKVKDLTLAECAILAGLPQKPSVYSPYSKTPKAYVQRTVNVLKRMEEDKYIKKEVMGEAIKEVENFEFKGKDSNMKAPHFVYWIKEKLIEKYGENLVEGGGLKITSTLDWDIQEKAEKIVKEEIDKAEKMGISNGSAVIIDPNTGEVLAMVGSRDYGSTNTDGKFNVATQGLRQPGSAIKPITYLMALRNGMTPASLVLDTPVTFAGTAGQKDYSPNNYNGKFNGPMTLRTALGNSINTVAVKMLANVGVENMLGQAFEMGITTLEPTQNNLSRFGLAVTLGGAEVKMIELAQAYGAFANKGIMQELVGVLKVEDNTGRVLEEYKKIDGKKVMSSQEAFLISNILSDNSARELTFGAVNGLIVSNYQVAVKTGTTNDKRDNWAIGWTPNLLVAAWVGNNDNSPMLKVASGVSGATPIWKKMMLAVISKRTKEDFAIPESVISTEVDKTSGYPKHDGFESRNDYFIDGTVPKIDDPIHLKLKVCKSSSGLAPPEDVNNNNYDEKEYFRFKEEDPISKDGKNRWQEGIDKWISEQADKDKYNPPESYCRSGGLVTVNFDSPSNESTTGNDISVKLNTNSLKKVVEAKLFVNGVEKKSWSEKPFETSINLSDGTYVLKAEVKDKDGNSASSEVKIGVNMPWGGLPTAIPTMVPTVTGI